MKPLLIRVPINRGTSLLAFSGNTDFLREQGSIPDYGVSNFDFDAPVGHKPADIQTHERDFEELDKAFPAPGRKVPLEML